MNILINYSLDAILAAVCENRAIKHCSCGRRADITRWTSNSCARHSMNFSVIAKG